MKWQMKKQVSGFFLIKELEMKEREMFKPNVKFTKHRVSPEDSKTLTNIVGGFTKYVSWGSK